ncbi:MAG: hypothetical protein WDW38_003753 [Sanguina aurantia]
MHHEAASIVGESARLGPLAFPAMAVLTGRACPPNTLMAVIGEGKGSGTASSSTGSGGQGSSPGSSATPSAGVQTRVPGSFIGIHQSASVTVPMGRGVPAQTGGHVSHRAASGVRYHTGSGGHLHAGDGGHSQTGSSGGFAQTGSSGAAAQARSGGFAETGSGGLAQTGGGGFVQTGSGIACQGGSGVNSSVCSGSGPMGSLTSTNTGSGSGRMRGSAIPSTHSSSGPDGAPTRQGSRRGANAGADASVWERVRLPPASMPEWTRHRTPPQLLASASGSGCAGVHAYSTDSSAAMQAPAAAVPMRDSTVVTQIPLQHSRRPPCSDSSVPPASPPATVHTPAAAATVHTPAAAAAAAGPWGPTADLVSNGSTSGCSAVSWSVLPAPPSPTAGDPIPPPATSGGGGGGVSMSQTAAAHPAQEAGGETDTPQLRPEGAAQQQRLSLAAALVPAGGGPLAFLGEQQGRSEGSQSHRSRPASASVSSYPLWGSGVGVGSHDSSSSGNAASARAADAVVGDLAGAGDALDAAQLSRVGAGTAASHLAAHQSLQSRSMPLATTAAAAPGKALKRCSAPAFLPTVLPLSNFFCGSLTGWGFGQAGPQQQQQQQQQQREQQRPKHPLSHVAEAMQYVALLLLLLLTWPLVMIFAGQSA